MVPEECRFTKEHEWVYAEDDVAVIGISEYAAGELGDIVYVELPEVDTEVQQMDPIGTIEAVKTVAELFSPVSGTIIEINEEIIEDHETVNKSPFADGWFIKIKMEDPGELEVLFSYEEYQEYLGEQAGE
ncbi:MAG: glycine cleavage system protein GcvH [Candidatus Krumholzibacteria bacterium]|jgi:glycine cleavage system H protein|nr:glycine cleavage system protein GcvH [Candidatus Krumholzibacteria bacterium]